MSSPSESSVALVVDDASVPAKIGRYEIVGRLATGGMAEIFLGRLVGAAGFERAVVVKRILPHLARRDDLVRMFLDEARLAARIHDDRVVQVLELGTQANELFIVQEYLQGESAFGLLRRLYREGRKLPFALAASIVAEACAGLHVAHELTGTDGELLGVVHRDVSPDNVFITYAGRVKLLDFGIALARGRLAQTETGTIKGKFGYMSPEQCRGEPLDRRSDLFSLGVVLHELVTGSRLFKSDNALATVKAICELPIPRLSMLRPDCPPALDRICARALERTPGARYATADAMRDDLVRVMRSDGLDDPERACAATMNELFADRVREKRRMLDRLGTGGPPPSLPTPEAEGDGTVPALSRLLPKRRRWPIPVVVFALSFAVTAIVAHGRHHAPTATTTAPPTLPAAEPLATAPDVDVAPVPVVEAPPTAKPHRADKPHRARPPAKAAEPAFHRF